jgi:hypothetical protein
MFRGLRRPKRLEIPLALILYCAANVRAASGEFQGPASGERLEPGNLVAVSWSLDRIGREDDEMELILSLDGGATFPIRVTADLDPATRRILWRVPYLPAQMARLAIRTGSDREPAEETIQMVGPVFSILASERAALEELFGVQSEWRTREALGSAREPVRRADRFGSTEEILPVFPDEIPARSPTRTASLSTSVSDSPRPIASPPPARPMAADVATRICPTPLRE